MTDPNQQNVFVPPSEDTSAPLVPVQAAPVAVAPAQPSVFVTTPPPQFAPQYVPAPAVPAPPPGAEGGPAFMFTPPAEAPAPSPDPSLGVPGSAPFVGQAPMTQPVNVEGTTPTAANANAAPIPAAPVVAVTAQPVVPAPQTPAPAPAPSPSAGMSPEEKARRLEAIKQGAKKSGRKLKIQDVDANGAPSASAPAAPTLAQQAPRLENAVVQVAAQVNTNINAQLAQTGPNAAPAPAPAPAAAPATMNMQGPETVQPDGSVESVVTRVPAPAAAEVTGDDLLDHPNVRKAKRKYAAKVLSPKAKRALAAKEKRAAKKLAAKEKKAAKLAAKQAKAEKKAARIEARKAKALAKKEARAARLAAKKAKKAGKADRSASAKRAAKTGAQGHEQMTAKGPVKIFTVRVAADGAKKVKADAKEAGLELSAYIRKKLGV